MWSAALLVSFCGCLVDIWSKKRRPSVPFLPQLLAVEHRSTFIQLPGESALKGDALVFTVCSPAAFIKKKQNSSDRCSAAFHNDARVHLRGVCWAQAYSILFLHAWKKDEEKLVFPSERLINGCLLEGDVPVLVSCNIDVRLFNWMIKRTGPQEPQHDDLYLDLTMKTTLLCSNKHRKSERHVKGL